MAGYFNRSNRWHIRRDLEIEGKEVECLIEYDYTPGDPGCHTMRNGDPGWPPTGPEITINRITTVSGVDVTNTVDHEPLMDAIEEYEQEAKESALCDQADALNDEAKIREWQERQEMRCDD